MIRSTILLILIYARVSKFFTAEPDPKYFTRPNLLTFGIFFVQALEFMAAAISIDVNAGVHCTYMLILFNYTPTRVCVKSPCCFLLLFAYSVYMAATYGIPAIAGTQADTSGQIWILNAENGEDPWDLLSVSIGSSFLFFFLQTTQARYREKNLARNYYEAQYGTNQELILGERRKQNQELLDSMLPIEVSGKSEGGEGAPNVQR